MPAAKLDINLLGESNFNSKPLGKFLRWSLTYGRYIIIGTQIIVLLAFFSRFKFDRDLSDLNTRIEEQTNIVQALSPVEDNTRILQKRLEILKKMETSRSLYSDVINIFKKNTPKEVTINQLIFNQKQLTFNGKASTNSAFNSFLSFIRQNALFTQITLEDISIGSDGNLSYKISLRINPDNQQTKKTAGL